MFSDADLEPVRQWALGTPPTPRGQQIIAQRLTRLFLTRQGLEAGTKAFRYIIPIEAFEQYARTGLPRPTEHEFYMGRAGAPPSHRIARLQRVIELLDFDGYDIGLLDKWSGNGDWWSIYNLNRVLLLWWRAPDNVGFLRVERAANFVREQVVAFDDIWGNLPVKAKDKKEVRDFVNRAITLVPSG